MQYNYRMPCGEMTDDVDHYISEWRRLAAPLEEHLDLALIAFDPSLSLASKEHGHKTVSIEKWLAFKLFKVLTGQEFLPDQQKE